MEATRVDVSRCASDLEYRYASSARTHTHTQHSRGDMRPADAATRSPQTEQEADTPGKRCWKVLRRPSVWPAKWTLQEPGSDGHLGFSHGSRGTVLCQKAKREMRREVAEFSSFFPMCTSNSFVIVSLNVKSPFMIYVNLPTRLMHEQM